MRKEESLSAMLSILSFGRPRILLTFMFSSSLSFPPLCLPQPTLLGLNKNAGQEISLRLLTDDLSGTRSYLEVRKVLCHELAHNRVGPQYVRLASPFSSVEGYHKGRS